MFVLRFTGGQKINGSAIPITLRNRPRIPTPDVTKEVMDRENRLASMGMQHGGHMGVALMAQQGYQNEVPVLGALVLSPIQELDSGSVNNTLHAGQPGTAALAQAVLSPALTSAGLAPMLTAAPVVTPVTLTPMNVSQLSTLVASSAPSTPRTERIGSTPTPPRAVITELSNSGSDKESEGSNGSRKSSPSVKERSRKSSSGSKRGEVYV